MESSQRTVQAVLDGTPYATRISTRGLEIVADEPADLGGKDLGMTPHDIFLGALSSCVAITLRMYAERKKWDTGALTVTATMDRSQEGRDVSTKIQIDLKIENPLPDDQRERLLQIAGLCPVHRTLESPLTITKALIT